MAAGHDGPESRRTFADSVNLDDGFVMSSAPNPRDTLGTFLGARNPGGGYRNGALAQEETLARSSGLVPTLESLLAAARRKPD